jgi:hypothetical protein
MPLTRTVFYAYGPIIRRSQANGQNVTFIIQRDSAKHCWLGSSGAINALNLQHARTCPLHSSLNWFIVGSVCAQGRDTGDG